MRISTLNDSVLLAHVCAGDSAALGELYDRHAPILLGIAQKILQDRGLAQDVVQDAFLALYEKGKRFDPTRGSVIAWLVTSTRHRAIDKLRTQSRRRTILRELVRHEPAEMEPLSDLQPDRQQVDLAMAALPEAQRQTLNALYFEGLSYSELAARTGVPLGTVKARAVRGLMALRQRLADEPAFVGESGA